MPKVKGPLFSLSARKTLGKNITFKKQLRLTIAHKHFIPADAKTATQISIREAMSELQKKWNGELTTEQRETWEWYARYLRFPFPGYNSFLKYNFISYHQTGAYEIWAPQFPWGKEAADMIKIERMKEAFTITEQVHADIPGMALTLQAGKVYHVKFMPRIIGAGTENFQYKIIAGAGLEISDLNGVTVVKRDDASVDALYGFNALPIIADIGGFGFYLSYEFEMTVRVTKTGQLKLQAGNIDGTDAVIIADSFCMAIEIT